MTLEPNSGDGGNRTHALFLPNASGVAVGIPLRNRQGTIRAFAMVDAADHPRLDQHRWCISNGRWGHVGRKTDGRWIYLHREVYGLDPEDVRRLDHINGDPLDNRRANLRLATTAENAQNQGSRGGSSRYRGVTWDRSRQKWMATGMLHGKRKTIGRFDSEDEAGEAAAAWRAEHMPFSQEAGLGLSVAPRGAR